MRKRYQRLPAPAELPDPHAKKRQPGYTISEDRRAITCHRCHMTSYNPNDVTHRYCAACKMFHEEER